jgi:peptidoglycan/LPS O-acetylase OafA/YrhL
VVYIVVNASLPEFSARNLLSWLTMTASGNLMPFPVAQVWFLHTLLFILLVSPVYFELFDRKPWSLLAIMIVPMGLATLQLFDDVYIHFQFAGNNFYKPIVHSIFFIFGFVWLLSGVMRRTATLLALMIGCGLAAAALVWSLGLDLNYPSHAYSPDLYYILGGVSAIAGLLAMQPLFLRACDSFPPLSVALGFMYRYTFPVFLLHSFSIYLAEDLLGLVHPQKHVVLYGIVKFAVVLAATCVLAVPFGRFSNWLNKRIMGACTPRVRSAAA